MANTRDTMGEQACLDALIAHSLIEFEDDGVSSLRQYAFYNQSQLTKVKLLGCTSIGSYAFSGCTALTEIWLGATVPSISSGALPSKFASGAGAIYVPRSAVASYRSNSSWATWKWHIVAQEDYPVTNFDSITDSLSEMCTKLANGTANYDVGDFKTIDLGTEGEIRFQVAAKNVDALATGSGNAAYTWIAMDLLNTSHRMNPSLSGTTEGTGAIGGWGKSEMRTYLSTTIWALIPAELQAVIKEVKKYSCIYNTSSTKVANDETSDKLWIPSTREMFNNSTYETTGPAYTGTFSSATNRKRYKTGASTPSDWWARSANITSHFGYVNTSGNDGGRSADNIQGVLLGFCT